MDRNEKIKRGEQILSNMKSVVNNFYANIKHGVENRRPPHFSYYEEILHAVSEETHEVPIDRTEMCIALAEAEEQKKKVYVEPDDKFLPDKTGKVSGQCDGWTYHIEIR